MSVNSIELGLSDDERRLEEFGLSTQLIYSVLRPGLSRALNRTAMAMNSTPGTDIYHDAMEQLNLRLKGSGWRLDYVDGQPRLVHPEGLMALTVASGEDVASPDRRLVPRTRRKGKATRAGLASPKVPTKSLFDTEDGDCLDDLNLTAGEAPLWLLVHERTERGLNVELSRPAEMTRSGVVTDWDERIILGFLDLDGDLSVFETQDDAGIDVAVQPL